MGLDFSHCGAHWAYSGFMIFRVKLAQEIGIELRKMHGFQDWLSDSPGRPWSEVQSDPILPLLNHSDCDGELSPEECRTIAPRLRELVAGWPDDDRDKIKALELAEGMDTAQQANEPFEFR